MAQTTYSEPETARVEHPTTGTSWGAIFAGALLSIALGVLFISLGAAIGITTLGGHFPLGIAGMWWTGAWSFVSIVVATFVGALVATKASTVLTRLDGGVQGFTIWALSLVAMIVFTSFVGASVVKVGGAGVVGGIAETTTPTVALQSAQARQAAPLPQAGPVQGGQVRQATEATAWWFFTSALFGALAGILGGVIGLPRGERRRMQVQRARTQPATQQPARRESEV